MQRNQFPKKICQYGEDCYRKNPIHFKEYSHPHLEAILLKGIDSTTKEYQIPNELSLSKDIVLIQLQILENLFPPSKTNSNGNTSSDSKPQGSDSKDSKLKPDIKNPTQNSSQSEKAKQNEAEENEHKKNNSSNQSSQKINHLTTQDLKKDRSKSPSPSSTRTRQSSPIPSTSSASISSSNNSEESSHVAKKPKITKNIHDYISVVVPKGQMAQKLEKAAPYNFFLTTITDSPATHHEPLSITFQEILDESLGEIESSVQINFMVDIGWVLGHYYFAGCLDTPLLVLYGDDSPELQKISEKKPQVTAVKVQMSSPFATHHSKLMLFAYKDGSMRIVVSTANLYEDDWHNRTQGIWMSPKLEPLPDDCDTNFGESTTGFRNDLLLYLDHYKIAKLQPWIVRIRKTDFRSIGVFFIASVPGGFRESPVRGHPWGHARLGTLLSKHSAKIDDSCPIVAQSSSIGSLGPNIQSWILTDFVNSLRRDSTPIGIRRQPQFKMIYPSYGNVKNSHDQLLGGGCLPYGKKTDDKQPWLKQYLHQWRSKERHRSQAMPHIKTYCRWSENEGLYWFVLTSANLSKAAWGAFNKTSKIEPAFRIMNYEAGVLFLPRFLTGEDTFPMHKERIGIPPFPMPYDIPLTPYGPDDVPFLMDYLMEAMEK